MGQQPRSWVCVLWNYSQVELVPEVSPERTEGGCRMRGQLLLGFHRGAEGAVPRGRLNIGVSKAQLPGPPSRAAVLLHAMGTLEAHMHP